MSPAGARSAGLALRFASFGGFVAAQPGGGAQPRLRPDRRPRVCVFGPGAGLAFWPLAHVATARGAANVANRAGRPLHNVTAVTKLLCQHGQIAATNSVADEQNVACVQRLRQHSRHVNALRQLMLQEQVDALGNLQSKVVRRLEHGDVKCVRTSRRWASPESRKWRVYSPVTT